MLWYSRSFNSIRWFKCCTSHTKQSTSVMKVSVCEVLKAGECYSKKFGLKQLYSTFKKCCITKAHEYEVTYLKLMGLSSCDFHLRSAWFYGNTSTCYSSCKHTMPLSNQSMLKYSNKALQWILWKHSNRILSLFLKVCIGQIFMAFMKVL